MTICYVKLAFILGAVLGTRAQPNTTDQLGDFVQDNDSQPTAIVYYVTAPKVVRRSQPYEVSVTIQKGTSPVAINLQRVTTLTTEGPSGWTTTTTITAEANGTVLPGSTQRFILGPTTTLPEADRGQLLLISGKDEHGNNFTDSSSLSVQKSNLIFVQTDKPLYKLGDLVKFRVILVDLALKPLQVPLDIKLYDPQRNLIQQHLQVNKPKDRKQAGFFEGGLQLASEALLGEWIIEVTSKEGAEPTQKGFLVEEYVLPRFDVKVKVPPYVISRQSSFEVTVTASYTFGEPVKGKAYIQVDGPKIWDRKRRRDFGLSQNFTISEFNGTAKVRVYVADLVNITEEFRDWNSIAVSANVTEETTNTERKTNLQFISLKAQPYKLTIIKSTSMFKPGFPYTISISAVQHDGRPIPPTTKKMVVKVSSSESIYSSEYVFDEEVHTFSVPINGTVDVTFIPAKQARRIFLKARLGKVTDSSSIGGINSPSNSFMQIYPLFKNISVGDNATFNIRLTNAFDVLNYTIISKGQIIWENSLHFNGTSATVIVPISKSMTPRSRLLVYYMRPDSEVVANVIDFEVSGLLQNNVSVSIRPESRIDYAEPGESVVVRVETAPNSFVAMLAVDQSLLLLKSGNDVSEKDVTEAVQAFDADSWSFDDDFGFSRFKFPDSRSVFSFLEQAGLVVLSNAAIPGRVPDLEELILTSLKSGDSKHDTGTRTMYSASIGPVTTDINKCRADVNRACENYSTSRKRPSNGSLANILEPQLRKDFRETFLYESFSIGSSGVVEFSRQVPDTITSWVCSAFSLNNEVGLAITKDSSKLRVFRPFFAVLNLPFSIIRGETVQLEVLVFNYLERDQNVQVTLEVSGYDANHTKFTDPPQKKAVMVTSQNSVSVSFSVNPAVVGDIELKASAVSDMAGDLLVKTLKVRPEGIRQQFNAPLFIDLRNQPRFSADVMIPLPHADIVPGSEKLVFSAIGDLLGPTIHGIDNLIRLPSGCGEQSMARFAPNVFVMKYLSSARRLDDETKRKLLRNMKTGFQRQLTFKHHDNSYSAFGDTDIDGSTFLTAFVARTFYQAQEFTTIDKDFITGALDYLIQTQAENGSFPERGKVFDRQLQGGAGRGLALTAYTLITFLEARSLGNYSENIENATKYIESQLSTISADPYALSIVSYALQQAGSNAAKGAFDKLETLAVVANGTKHWEKERETETQAYGKYTWEYKLPSKDIEMTAYNLLSAVRRNDIEGGFPILAWLLSKRNEQGGFQTSQDTVVGLQAISEFAVLVASKNRNIKVNLKTDGYNKDFSITDENALVLQNAEPDKFYSSINVSGSGSGTGLVQVSWIYYVRNTTDDQGFAVTTSIKKGKASIVLQICSKYLKNDSSNMAVMEINLPSGYQVDDEETKKIIKSVPGLSRVDILDDSTSINLYFDKFTNEQMCVSITAYRMYTVDNLQDSNVVLYDYYNPKDQSRKFYNSNRADVIL